MKHRKTLALLRPKHMRAPEAETRIKTERPRAGTSELVKYIAGADLYYATRTFAPFATSDLINARGATDSVIAEKPAGAVSSGSIFDDTSRINEVSEAAASAARAAFGSVTSLSWSTTDNDSPEFESGRVLYVVVPTPRSAETAAELERAFYRNVDALLPPEMGSTDIVLRFAATGCAV